MIGLRRAIVEVRWARVPVRRVVLAPGSALRLGRAPRRAADERDVELLAVPDDRQMSSAHCELHWDGRKGQVEDLESQTGVLLNGEKCFSGDVKNGDWIRAGGTVLVVHCEGSTPPPRESGLLGDGSDQMTRQQEDVMDALARERDPLFAVLNAACDLRIVQVLHESVEEHQSLYEGIPGEALALQAPYLVRLPPRSRLLDQLVLEGWGKGWGIFLTCPRPFKEVRTHLRRFLMVTNDRNGQKVYFRFYDPPSLRVFLPIATPRQRAQLFGETSAFLMETKDGELLRAGPSEAPVTVTARPNRHALEVEP